MLPCNCSSRTSEMSHPVEWERRRHVALFASSSPLASSFELPRGALSLPRAPSPSPVRRIRNRDCWSPVHGPYNSESSLGRYETLGLEACRWRRSKVTWQATETFYGRYPQSGLPKKREVSLAGVEFARNSTLRRKFLENHSQRKRMV